MSVTDCSDQRVSRASSDPDHGQEAALITGAVSNTSVLKAGENGDPLTSSPSGTSKHITSD